MFRSLVLDGDRLLADLDALARIGRSPDGALNRIAYSAADQQGRAWVASEWTWENTLVSVEAALAQCAA